MHRVVLVAHVCAAVGCGLMAGLFFVFSAFMMRALGRLPVPQGIAAMQSINVTIQNPAFFLLFFGTTASCLLLGAGTVLTNGQPAIGWRLAGAVLFVGGVFVVTVVFNVPLNNALDAAEPATAEGAQVWQRYRVRWTAWNHLRTLSATAAAVILTVGLRWV